LLSSKKNFSFYKLSKQSATDQKQLIIDSRSDLSTLHCYDAHKKERCGKYEKL